MEDELWDAAERVAGDLDRSVSWVIRKAIEEYVERHRTAKRAAKQAADTDLDRSDRKPVIATRRDRKR
jgi:predicted transcriptional regulator